MDGPPAALLTGEELKVLLTGAAGQLGTSLQDELAGRQVTALERDALDITRLDAVRAAIEAHRPELVINCAAYNAVDAAETEIDAAFRGNALGPRNLAVATAAAAIPLVHVSTDYVFDGEAGRPYHEFDRPYPASVYGASKLAGEEAVRSLNARHFIIRTAWVYHPRGRNFANTILALARKGPVRVVDDQHGSPTYAPHLAEGILRLVQSAAYGTYHIAGRGGTTWFGFAVTLFRALGVDAELQSITTEQFPRPAKRPRFAVLTTIQDPAILLPPWQDGVGEFAEWVRQAR
jgi:dTDP-4-dehydrorhamnose reductase